MDPITEEWHYRPALSVISNRSAHPQHIFKKSFWLSKVLNQSFASVDHLSERDETVTTRNFVFLALWHRSVMQQQSGRNEAAPTGKSEGYAIGDAAPATPIFLGNKGL